MWLLIDNYDSFTYILHHYLCMLHPQVEVVKNDAITIAEITNLNPECIILSPGPQRPLNAGITMQVVAHFIGKIPILGVCLGHQALGEYLGAQLVKADFPMHGKSSVIQLTDKASHLLALPKQMEIMRYHSLILKNYESIHEFEPLAFANDDGALMMFCSTQYKCFGIQFHPESIGTKDGLYILKAWQQWMFQTK